MEVNYWLVSKLEPV